MSDAKVVLLVINKDPEYFTEIIRTCEVSGEQLEVQAVGSTGDLRRLLEDCNKRVIACIIKEGRIPSEHGSNTVTGIDTLLQVVNNDNSAENTSRIPVAVIELDKGQKGCTEAGVTYLVNSALIEQQLRRFMESL